MDPTKVIETLNAMSECKMLLYLAEICSDLENHIAKYFRPPWRRFYFDSLVIAPHKVNSTLPKKALSLITQSGGNPAKGELDSLLEEYLEPIAALQDDDLRIKNKSAEYAYYAIYNLLRVASGEKDLVGTVLSQAISSHYPRFAGSPNEEREVANLIELWWKNCGSKFA